MPKYLVSPAHIMQEVSVTKATNNFGRQEGGMAIYFENETKPLHNPWGNYPVLNNVNQTLFFNPSKMLGFKSHLLQRTERF
jgi:hypothetical protein